VLHHCVVMFFRSSGIMDCMLFTLKKNPAHALECVSGAAELLPLMNSYNNFEAAIFFLQTILNRTNYFLRLIKMCLLQCLM